MILIPNALLLSEAEDLQNSIVGYQTFTRAASGTPVAASTVTASTEAADGPKDGPLRPNTYEYWKPTALPATWQIDFGSAKEVDYVGIAAHTLGSDNCSAFVEYSSDASTWTAFSVETHPADDTPLMFIDDVKFARYWRVTVEGDESPGTPPRLGVIYIGKYLAMQRGIYGGHKPITLSRDTTLKNALSRGGQFLGQNYRRNGVATDAAYNNLEPAWVRSYFDPFVKSARRFPYFFAWRPSTYSAEVGFVWTAEDIAPSNMGVKDLMQVSWPMRGIGFGE